MVLGTTLLGAGGLAVLVLVPVVFEEPPPGLERVKPIVAVLIGVAVVLFVAEWLGVH